MYSDLVKSAETRLNSHQERSQLNKLSPFSLLSEVNNLFDDIFNTDLFVDNRQAMPLSTLSQRSHVVTADEEKMEINVDLPGVKPGDIDVSMRGNEVQVEAKRGGRLQRYSWLVRQDYDSMNPKARLEDGVLTLTFPKKPEAQSRKIEIDLSK